MVAYCATSDAALTSDTAPAGGSVAMGWNVLLAGSWISTSATSMVKPKLFLISLIVPVKKTC